MISIEALGVDAAFANMGLVRATIVVMSPDNIAVRVHDMRLVSTTADENKKVVRKSSSDLRRAQELSQALSAACKHVQYVFAEIPSGAQSAAAARALGIAVGVLAGAPVPLIEVSPGEVKAAVSDGMKQRKAPSKAEVIAWAHQRWPDAPWLQDKKGKLLNANEHLADALAVIMAGCATQEFKRMIPLFSLQARERRRLVL